MTTSVESRKSERSAEVALLRLLSRFFVREVDEELASFLGGSLCSQWFENVPAWTPQLGEDTAVDYCRLFIVPGVCVPIAAAFLGGRKKKDAAEQEEDLAALVLVLLKELALELPPRLAELPPDHLSVLLEIWAWLLEQDEPEQAQHFEEAFIRGWVPKFVEKLTLEAEHPIYQGLARLSGEILNVEEK